MWLPKFEASAELHILPNSEGLSPESTLNTAINTPVVGIDYLSSAATF